MTDGAYQAITASAIPVTALTPPPEGQRQALLKIILTPTNFAQSFAPVLANAGLSQVVTLFVDNSQNAAPLTVIHGALNQVVIVPAGGGAFIPTSSTTALSYFVSVSIANAPTNNVAINLTLYNYFIGASIFGNTIITEETVITTSSLGNPFHNPGCMISQRGTGVISTNNGYTLDGYLIVGNGSSGLQVQQGGSLGYALNSLKIAGVSGNTDVKIIRRIESLNSTPYSLQQVTFQFKLENNSGAAIVPAITVQAPTSQDVFSSLGAAQYSGNAQSCPNGATTQCAVSFPINSAATGLQISIDIGALASTSAVVSISEFDLLLTPSNATGLIANPGNPRLPFIADDLAFCKRYLNSTYGNLVTPGSAAGLQGMALIATCFYSDSASSFYAMGSGFDFPLEMQRAPSLLYWDAAGNASKASNYYSAVEYDNLTLAGSFVLSKTGLFYRAATADVQAHAGGLHIHYLASAEL
jgi:hypothetical protein